MPNLIRSRNAPQDQWPLWVAGALAGVLASWLFLRPRAGDPVPSGVAHPIAGTRERLTGRARARGAPSPPDLTALTERLHARPGTGELRVRSLGGGILELVGSAPDDVDLAEVLDALAAEPGVSVVVNRVWTSRSGAP